MRCVDLALPCGIAEPAGAARHMAANLWLPPEAVAPRALLVCLPGGYMNRHYFDLRPVGAADDAGFSFAARMTACGYAVVALDYLGIGDSDHPADGWSLTPEVLTRANAAAVAELVVRLQAGDLAPELKHHPELPVVGIGHSMGAMLTILLQAAARPFAGLVLLGFSTRGMPDYVPKPLLELAARDLPAARAGLQPFAAQMFAAPYARLQRGGSANLFYGTAVLPGAIQTLRAAAAPLLSLPGLLAMVPGSVDAEAARIEVPVFLGVGDHDIVGLPHAIPASFPAVADLMLAVLPHSGHSHFLFAGRERLYARLNGWLASGVLG